MTEMRGSLISSFSTQYVASFQPRPADFGQKCSRLVTPEALAECARPRAQQRPNTERAVLFQHLPKFPACCARGRAHSGPQSLTHYPELAFLTARIAAILWLLFKYADGFSNFGVTNS
jgi:hypothetical protein